MDQKQLDAIKERVVALEDYRWEAEISEDVNMSEVVAIQNNGFCRYGVAIEMDERDAEFIAHARQDVPALLAEVERLREALEKIMEVEVLITEGWETSVYKIAHQALGGESK